MNPWSRNATADQLIAARRAALFMGVLALVAIIYLALDFNPLVAIPVALFMLSSPGFIDISLYSMMDIYLTSFITLALVCVSYYMLRGNKWGLRLGAIFLGLALGSKNGWDPIIATLAVIVLCAFSNRQGGIRKTLLATAECFGLVFIAYALTNPVILMRPSEHFSTVFAGGASQMGFSHILGDQPLVNSEAYYSVFRFQLPSNLGLFAVALIGLSVLAIRASRSHQALDRSALRYMVFVGLFASVGFLLSANTFDFGRFYSRDAAYEALTLAVFLIMISRSSIRVGFGSTLLASISGAYSFVNYVGFLALYYWSTGSALLYPLDLNFQWSYAPVVGWAVFLSIIVTVFVLSTALFRLAINSKRLVKTFVDPQTEVLVAVKSIEIQSLDPPQL